MAYATTRTSSEFPAGLVRVPSFAATTRGPRRGSLGLVIAFEVHHPLVGALVPSLESLRQRADARAGESLEIAARLCMHRIFEQRQLRARAEKLDAPPWAGSTTRLRTHPEALVPGDLLKALLVCEPERIAATLAEDLRAEAYADVVSALSSWSGPARNAPPRLDAFELRLHPAWARRWALADVRHRKPQVTVPGLFSALGLSGLEGLAAFSKRFVDGAQTRHEVAVKFVQRSPREVVQRLHDVVPPAYVDRHGGLAALDAGLAGAPGVLVVGAPRSGRSELLRAWVRRVTHDGLRPDWEGRVVLLDPHTKGGPLPAGALVGLTAARGGAADEEVRMQWLAAHAGELGAGGSLRVMVVVEPGAVPRWIERVPALGSFPRVEVPAIAPPAQAAIWLAHTLARPGLGLDHVLAVLDAVGLESAMGIDPWALDQLVRPAGLLSFYTDEDACRELTTGAAAGGRPSKDATAKEQKVAPALLQALGGTAGIEALRGLEARLRPADG